MQVGNPFLQIPTNSCLPNFLVCMQLKLFCALILHVNKGLFQIYYIYIYIAIDQQSPAGQCHPQQSSFTMSAVQISSIDETITQLTTPMQVEDDDVNSPAEFNNQMEKQLENCAKSQKEVLVTQGGTTNRKTYQNNVQQLKSIEREFQYRKSEMELQQHQHQQHHNISQAKINTQTVGEGQKLEEKYTIVVQQNELLTQQLQQQQIKIQELENRLSTLCTCKHLHANSHYPTAKTLQKEYQNQMGKNQTVVVEKYQMGKNPHGIAVIINNFSFHLEAQPCWDSIVDEGNLCTAWRSVHYDVLILRNLTASELTHQLKDVALKNHEKYDSFVCCILSYGYLDNVYGTDVKLLNINDIVTIFKHNVCPTLAGKPKLFFILTLHGIVRGNTVVAQPSHEKDVFKDSLHQFLVGESDFFFAYTTGNMSWRNRLSCISKLCEVFKDHVTQHNLIDMLSIVNNKIESGSNQGRKQYSISVVSSLSKQLWFL